MSDYIDWLHSPRDVCKVELYNPKEQQEQKPKMVCFIEVSTLNAEDKSSKDTSGSGSGGFLALENLEEKEIIVIKNTEKQDQSKMEGSICLFKQTPSDPVSVQSCLFDDLQKFALGFQHALSPSASSRKHKIEDTEEKCHKPPSANCYGIYADQLNISYMNDRPQSLCLEMTAAQNTNNIQSLSTPPPTSPNMQRAIFSSEGENSSNDLSFYGNTLSKQVDQMAPNEIKEKLENENKSFPHSIYPPSGDKEKNSPHSVVSKVASEMVHDVLEMTSAEISDTGEECKEGVHKTFLNNELSNKSKARDIQMCQKNSKDVADPISKVLELYANQVAPDIMASVMRTFKVKTSGKPISACMVLKRVFLKHTQEIVSDLIDSCMKNLHDITGTLMADCDFISAVKRNLFNHGKQNATDIVEAMLKHLVRALLGENKETKSQNLYYASLTSGSHDLKGKNQSLKFSTVEGETRREDRCKIKPDPCKSLTRAERVGEHILKESLTMWNQSQGKPGKLAVNAQASQEGKRGRTSPFVDSLAKDLIVSALRLIQYYLAQQAMGKEPLEEDSPGSTMGYMSQAAQYESSASGQRAKALSLKHLESHGAAGPSTSLKETQQTDCQTDMSNIVLSLIQKLLSESSFNCDELSEGENKLSEPKANKATSMSKREHEQREHDPDLDFASGIKQMNHRLTDQLVEAVLKLCLILAQYSNHGEALAEGEERAAL